MSDFLLFVTLGPRLSGFLDHSDSCINQNCILLVFAFFRISINKCGNRTLTTTHLSYFRKFSISSLFVLKYNFVELFDLSRSGACFSKVPKLFGRISGDTIFFVSSKRRCLEAQNFAVILIFIPFRTYGKTSFTE